MKVRFREKNLTVIAIVGVVGMLAVLFGSFQIAALPIIAGTSYEAVFSDAGGLKAGDDVKVAGTEVGEVSDVEISDGAALVSFTAKDVVLGDTTTAQVSTQTLLGERYLGLSPRGVGEMSSGDRIPLERTRSPYSVTQAIEDLTARTSQIDNQQVGAALNAFSEAFRDTPDEIGPAFDGITRLSRTLSSRDEALQQLLERAENVTGLLRDHTQNITSIIQQGNLLLSELQARRDTIHQLLVETTRAADQAAGFINEQQGQLKPALDQLNQAVAVLRRNEGNIVSAVQRVSSFITGLGEGLSTGPQFSGIGDLGAVPGTVFNPAQFFTGLTLPTGANPAGGLPTGAVPNVGGLLGAQSQGGGR